ncbi:hypothetical protein CEXT_233301 [Caerostris extrusa]|uniref:Uncharacterized protein n=1 Tax=Caerostris extrusa TaxID=172846 RepID=A0AAV4WP39_CAEEX|nr:hypothetical protein CEXT_233301 [Caerostris extrusa]
MSHFQFGDRLTSFSPSESIVLKASRRKEIKMQVSLPRLGCMLVERVHHVGNDRIGRRNRKSIWNSWRNSKLDGSLGTRRAEDESTLHKG